MKRWKLGANISNDPRQAAADCALVASLGGRVVRTSQEQPGGADRLDAYRKACDDHGLELFQTCQPTGHVVPKTQQGLDAFAEYGAECASKSDRTSGGNEVSGFGSNEVPNPAGQAEMFLALIERCKKLGIKRRLATPSTCPGGGKLGQYYVEPLLFTLAMLDAQPTILRHGIELDWHGYCDSRYPATTKAWWNTANRSEQVHADLVTLGHEATKICMSEFGAATGPLSWEQRVNPETQAVRFDQYLQEWWRQRSIGVPIGEVIWYQLRNTSGGQWPDYCGLVDVHGAPMPIAARFTAAAKMVDA